MVQFLSINFFSWISSIFVVFFKSSRFFVSHCICWHFQAESIRDAVWESNWVGTPVSFQHCLMFITVMAGKNFSLTAGKFVTVSNRTMIKVNIGLCMHNCTKLMHYVEVSLSFHNETIWLYQQKVNFTVYSKISGTHFSFICLSYWYSPIIQTNKRTNYPNIKKNRYMK